MKRSKSEMITATIESYLKRRHYQCDDIRQEHTQSSEEALLAATANCGISQGNSIVFSAITLDVAAADQAYQRIKVWINKILNDDLKLELKGLLYPVFCHLYLEILHCGNRQGAAQFLTSYQSDFTSEGEKFFLEELSSVFSVQDIELKPSVNAFRTRKYNIALSDVAKVCLQMFLAKNSHVILMQIINTHITITKRMDNLVNAESNDVTVSEIGINGHVEQPSGIGVDREMRELQEAIRLLRESAQYRLRIFNVFNSNENASVARVTKNIDKLAVGFSTAEIRLWGLGETVLMKPKVTSNVSTSFGSSSSSDNLETHNIATCEAGAIVLRGHSDVVHDLRFIPECNVLLSVSSDSDMRAWNLNDYSCASVYRGHSCPIWCMDTSVFNMHIVTGSDDRTAKLWSLDRTFPLRIFAGHFLDVNSVKFHPNARYLATGSADKTVRLWDKNDGSLLRVLAGARTTVFSLAFSGDGKYLAAGDDEVISIWDLASNSMITELKGHSDTIMNLDWSSDDQFLVSGSLDGAVRRWSVYDHIKTANSNASNSVRQLDPTQIYETNCSTVLYLGYHRNNSLVLVGRKDES